MKSKDVLALIFAAVIFLVAGYIGYTQILAPKSSGTKTSELQVEVVGAIPSNLDQSALDQLNDTTKTEDFTPVIDLNGLGNGAPFGQ